MDITDNLNDFGVFFSSIALSDPVELRRFLFLFILVPVADPEVLSIALVLFLVMDLFSMTDVRLSRCVPRMRN